MKYIKISAEINIGSDLKRQLIRVSWKGGLTELFRVDNRMPLLIKDTWMKFLMHVMGDA